MITHYDLYHSEEESEVRLCDIRNLYKNFLSIMQHYFISKDFTIEFYKPGTNRANKDIVDKEELIKINNETGEGKVKIGLFNNNDQIIIEIDLDFEDQMNLYCSASLIKDNKYFYQDLRGRISIGSNQNFNNDELTTFIQEILTKINDYYKNVANIRNFNRKDNKNHKYEISELFEIMELIQNNKFKELNDRIYADGTRKMTYLITKLLEGEFIKINNDSNVDDLNLKFNEFQLTFKGHEYLKIWNTPWVLSGIKEKLDNKLKDLSMEVFMAVAVNIILNRKTT